eukprot:CAMPEP_0119507340 /NCGR_PEP_ID=MMETSP1344-20130328/27266_1 /TAXON_ID=236787 /ORGANISM="Florenciella parvula, Strain CCMP2471" /LENGTH=415 /DNA_ID=CAMNT_0007543965 /DNA_START=59 /DNA_END=1306 /DNA_ORIENTATION=-
MATSDFEPAATFQGSRSGKEYKMGSEGLGYYPTGPAPPAAAAAAAADSAEASLPPPPPPPSAAAAANASAVAKTTGSGDGIDPKERWHWKERDLRDFINDWLTACMVTHNGGLLFENERFQARTTIIRGDFGDEGAAFLNWRKGKCFATYTFGVRFEYQGAVKMDGRVIGQSKGVVWLRDVGNFDDDEADANRPLDITGTWQHPPQGQQPGQTPLREPEPYEVQLKEAMIEFSPEPVRARICQLRKALDVLAEQGDKSLPKAEDVVAAMLEESGEAGAIAAATEEARIQADAAVKAEEYVEGLRRKHRHDRHVAALEDPTLATVSLSYCDLRPADIGELVDALKKNPVATTVDLNANNHVDDAALQPLLLALANGAMPELKVLNLQGTGASVVSRNMCRGLKMMRKAIEVRFDEE